MIILRQKHYNDEDGSSVGSKIMKGALALGGTAATFYGARKGMLGNTVQMHANKLYGKAGVQMQRFGNAVGGHWEGGGNFFAKRGNNMVESAAKEYGIANAQKNLIKDGMEQHEIVGAINKGRSQFKADRYKDYGGIKEFRAKNSNIDYGNMYSTPKSTSSVASTTTQQASATNPPGYSMTAADTQYYH